MNDHFNDWLLGQTTEKGGEGSGNFGHTGRPGKVGGSASESNMPAGARGLENAIQRVTHYALFHEGFTYQPVTQKSPKGGQAVSPFPDREDVFPSHNMKRKDVRDRIGEYVMKNMDLLSNPNNHLGGWFNSEDKNFYLDISVVAHSHEEAKRICQKYKQFAYYDLGEGKEYRLTEEELTRKEKSTVKAEKPTWMIMPGGVPTDEEIEAFVDQLMEFIPESDNQEEEKPEEPPAE